MPKRSAGLLMFRRRGPALEVLLAHPGGPFWARKDLGAWTIPKGEHDDSEDPLEAAKREFAEETGFAVREPFLPLGSARQASGKVVAAWAFESDCDPRTLASNTFEMEWPPKSARMAAFAEIDRAAWFTADEARAKLHKGQVVFLDALEKFLSRNPGSNS